MVAKVHESTDQTPDPPVQTPDPSSSPDTSPSTSSIPSPCLPPIDTYFITDFLSELTIMNNDNQSLPTIIELDTTSKPAKYDGTREGFKCLAWLKEVQRYFTMKNVPDRKRTIHAVNLLNQTSLLWWESLNIDDTCEYLTFTTLFKKAYMPDGFLEHVRGLLLNAKLTTNLAEYLTRIRLYMNILLAEDPTGRVFLESTVRVVFLQGCPDDLRQLLQTDQVSNPNNTFFDMCSKAEGFDTIYAFGPRGATKGMFAKAMNNIRSQTPTSNSAPTSAPAFDPMAMEIDNISVDPTTRALMSSVQSLTIAVNAMASQFNNQQQQQNRPRLARLTDEERLYLENNNGCFKCRRPNAGHYSWDCGKNRNTPRPPRSQAVNNIAYAGNPPTDQSGNAPSN
ncbi:hypothetical protein KI688_012427 [Linnemannia hyalina]|uniref:Retrotransposon gag domain-containing protein n=1 Tax=Linnemannia hyalina TaxID=64524 RepID=A0A9P7XW04_9FUNG|nr:hypothetical protein KI688_012427 [Linnemannia hyalina]